MNGLSHVVCRHLSTNVHRSRRPLVIRHFDNTVHDPDLLNPEFDITISKDSFVDSSPHVGPTVARKYYYAAAPDKTGVA